MNAKEQYKDASELARAMSLWMNSQEVSDAQGALAIAILLGTLLGMIAPSAAALDEGVDIMFEIVRKQAMQTLKLLGRV